VHPIKQLARPWLDYLLPESCLLCSADSGSGLLCADCTNDLPELPPAMCPLCSQATSYGERCGACLKEPPHFDRTIAAFRYDFPVDRIIHALKYGHQLAVADWLGEKLAKQIKAEKQLIIPLPLHADRLRERGFNQSAELARAIGNHLKLTVDRSIAFRNRATPPQAEQPLKERHKNVRGAFECRADLSGKHILLVDDVMTTGATVNECARVLKLHGVTEISVVVAARALKH
jgi:ComF family protein